MKRVVGVVAGGAVLAVLLACAGNGSGGDAAPAGAGGEAGGGGSVGGGGAGAGGGQDGSDPPRPPRVVSVSGPRLDNSTPDLSCAMLHNASVSMPVQIVQVTFRHDESQLVREDSHCPDSIVDDPTPTRICQSGLTLKPSAVVADGCRVGAVARKPGAAWNRVPARVELTLSVTCTSRAVAPCSKLPTNDEPSTSAPISVQWTVVEELVLNPGDYEE